MFDDYCVEPKMNERIRKLAEQAGIEFDDSFSLEPETIYYLKLSDFEKFAELIVRECAEFSRNYNLEKAERSYMIHKAIKEHFGVEE
jgi:hypothetical protein